MYGNLKFSSFSVAIEASMREMTAIEKLKKRLNTLEKLRRERSVSIQ